MGEQQKAATKGSRKTLEMARNTWKFIRQDYGEGHEHKNAGKPVVWSCALVEKELYYSMGLFPYYPEQFASLCAVRRKTKDSEKEAVRFARYAEQAGYSTDLCGYERVCTGYVVNGDLSDAPLGGMAPPDMLVTTSSVCDVRLKWFEDMAQRLQVPLFTLDRPEQVFEDIMGHPKPHEILYYRSQLEDFLSFTTEVTGNKFDQDRLNECMDWAYKTNELRLEILELRKNVPSPMGSADSFATMYPGMYCSGTERAYEFYKALRDEVRAKVKAGKGQIPNERFRLLWFGIPIWFNMSIFNYFEPVGGVFAYEPNYNPVPSPPRNTADPLTEMAIRTLSIGTSMGSRIRAVLEQCTEYNIVGGVLAYLITCRPYYLPVLELARVLKKELGVPSVFIESDLVDERSYSEAQVRTRMDAFSEMILKKMETEAACQTG
ncbi:MAG: 2-hydroxyacyl-CoA dehydratase family protein [Desulfobacterales bacterium]|jgi:benzoyl-CoA reductase/2-hydroxyglutaryl-CoA dehydratase subunit BcrC/BadD/HgdB|nr:2-hydroxyacyl-CoA dehydratase family protein [Desulfobacterales bacterium]MDP6684196.1 2-hydroxyacyl-CoA dehydratase family protein [Desulfobacterales bacterium]MDP6806965.1 2-hydroxyacyl-CoA dehydratase family protein [Desulfobacterales bacterium]|tara:strand:- start:4646 stop:5944 length:1299 start_codon:yes stop_codon:yes gene_type:complete